MQSETVLAEILAPPPIALPLCTLEPARFKAFVRLACQLVKLHGSRPISIKNSRLLQAIDQPTFLVDIDLRNYLPAAGSAADPDDDDANPGVSFNFQATDEEIVQLKDLVGESATIDVYDRGDWLFFSDGQQDVPLWKPAQPVPPLAVALPTDAERIGEEILIKSRAVLQKYVGRSGYVTLLAYADQLEKIKVPGKQPRALVVSAGGMFPVDRAHELALTSQKFLALAGDLDLSLGIYRNDRGYWLKTSSRPSMVNNLTTYELLYAGRV